jgi:hypothetical protein
MSTTFAAFVSTGVTLAYSCVRLKNFCPHQQVSQTAWLFEGNHGRLRKDLGQFGFFSTDVQCSRMVLKLFLRQGWYVRTQRVFLHFCFSLYWSKLLLEMYIHYIINNWTLCWMTKKKLSFNKVFNSLSLCFVYLVLFYKPF